MAVIATGFFDGVHTGHRLVIDTLLSEARARGEQSLIVTFWPHPRAVLQSGADSLRYLSSRGDRVTLLRSLGVDEVETVQFSREFASDSAREYISMLCRDYQCSELVLGYDTRFGREQAGPEEIALLAREMGVGAVIAPPVTFEGAPVSSSRIRTALSEGDVVRAGQMLGRPYRLSGVVVSGNRIGRKIGFPTANMKLYEPLMLVPQNGVYHTRVNVLGSWYDGMTNIGTRPTVDDRGALTIETHILDFNDMIYGLDITIDFVKHIRPEQKFPSLEALRFQLASDEACCR
ncbi:MAG: bifunctional riboflavin kinase/FAD synthetase [Bacteroidales bacterium]|nr:bifunctional riboflavin kinase/FAD synthetase [Bacteroidales bacterium]